MMTAGRVALAADEYSRSVIGFAWESLFYRSPSLFVEFAKKLAARFRYVLIDSRTGLTDIAGICTMLMPEKLVVVFTPSSQSLIGIESLVRRAALYRRQSNDTRPLVVFPLPSRVEAAREDLRSYWRFGNKEKGITGYQALFQDALKDVYGLEECKLDAYFDEVQIQQSADYAYGEEIAVLAAEEKDDRFSLSRSYRTFTGHLTGSTLPWEQQQEPQPRGPRPFCFVVTPFGVKRDPVSGVELNFDVVYAEILAPAIAKAGFEPIRADMDALGGILLRPVFERIILSEAAIFDLSLANPNVLYELGIRHAMRPQTTIPIIHESSRIPFDLASLRTIIYSTNIGAVARAQKQLTELLVQARTKSWIDSPVYGLIEGLAAPDISHIKTEVFRGRSAMESSLRQRIESAKRSGLAALKALESELGPVADLESGIAIDLLLAYRSHAAWKEMIDLVKRLSTSLAETAVVQQQLALALNRTGESDAAEKVLRDLLKRYGPSSQAYTLLGRAYHDRWERARRENSRFAGGLLRQAVQAYTSGFEVDWRDAYAGVSALYLMKLQDPPDPRRKELTPVVRYAVERQIANAKPTFWDMATLLQLAGLSNDKDQSAKLVPQLLATDPEAWQMETLLHDLREMGRTKKSRNEATDAIDAVIAALGGA